MWMCAGRRLDGIDRPSLRLSKASTLIAPIPRICADTLERRRVDDSLEFGVGTEVQKERDFEFARAKAIESLLSVRVDEVSRCFELQDYGSFNDYVGSIH
jgi:hypothetical protein